jgi:hypothetical protein
LGVKLNNQFGPPESFESHLANYYGIRIPYTRPQAGGKIKVYASSVGDVLVSTGVAVGFKEHVRGGYATRL